MQFPTLFYNSIAMKWQIILIRSISWEVSTPESAAVFGTLIGLNGRFSSSRNSETCQGARSSHGKSRRIFPRPSARLSLGNWITWTHRIRGTDETTATCLRVGYLYVSRETYPFRADTTIRFLVQLIRDKRRNSIFKSVTSDHWLFSPSSLWNRKWALINFIKSWNNGGFWWNE